MKAHIGLKTACSKAMQLLHCDVSENGGDEEMKNSSSVIRMALAAMFTAICLGIPGSVASAAKPNAGASVPPTTGSAPSPALPSGAGEVMKMFKGGISKDLIIGYINTTALAYHLSADEIIHLQTAGLPQEVIKAMIERGGQLQRQQVGQRQIGQLQQQRVDQQYYQPRRVPNGAYAAQPPAPYVMPSAPAPPVVMDGLDYPVYPAYDSVYHRITLDRLATTGRPWASEAWAGDAVGVGDLELVGTLAAAFEGEASVEALAAGVSAGVTCGGVVMGVKQPGQNDSQGRGGPAFRWNSERSQKKWTRQRNIINY